MVSNEELKLARKKLEAQRAVYGLESEEESRRRELKEIKREMFNIRNRKLISGINKTVSTTKKIGSRVGKYTQAVGRRVVPEVHKQFRLIRGNESRHSIQDRKPSRRKHYSHSRRRSRFHRPVRRSPSRYKRRDTSDEYSPFGRVGGGLFG